MTSNQYPENDVTLVLTSLRDIAEAVMHAAEAGTLEQVLERIAQVSRELVNARYAALGVPDGSGSLKYFKVVGVTPEQVAHIGHLPVGRGLLGAIMNQREVIRLPQMKDDPRSVGFPPFHPKMTSLLGVPIQLGDNLFGMLYLCDREDGEVFSDEDQTLVETLANYAALAIAGVQLSEQRGRLGLLEERERVGRELHDGTIQSLYAIGMRLQLLRLTQPLVADELGSVVHDLDTVIEDIRSYILNLKVVHYEQQTVYDCLEDVIARLHIPTDLSVDLNVPRRQPPFAPPVLESVCQIAYEAISNVIRHANARRLQISAIEGESHYQLVIEDDGSGFDLEQTHGETGLGLRNIQQRVRIHGGTVRVHSAPGAGTRVIVTVPIK